MKVEELLELHRSTCAAAFETMKRKNHDYTGGSADPFANFRMAEVIGVSAEKGLLVRMMDKMRRAQTFIDQGVLMVENETEDDLIEDIVNYAILLKGLFKERRAMSPITTTNISPKYSWER